MKSFMYGCVCAAAVLLGSWCGATAAQASPMPTELQWWKKKEITPIAKELAKRKVLKKFHKLLAYHIPIRRACRGKGLVACLPSIGAMRGGIDLFLRKITWNVKGALWWTDGSLCWVATIMVYGNNLENLHAFIGKQLRKPSAAKIDAYFKKIVNDHGGPLIDRNWNNP